MLVALILELCIAVQAWWRPPSRWSRVKDFPFDLLLKVGDDRSAPEADTIRFVRANTSIPVPYVIVSDRAFGKTYMLMRKAEGVSLNSAWRTLDAEQRAEVVEQLRSFVAQLRTLSPSLDCHHTVHAVCGLGNAPLIDSRISSMPVGPFPDECSFNDYLVFAARPYMDDTLLSSIRADMRDDHPIRFIHGDLAPRNIFVRGTVVTAVIDWEESGWYPEYWEFVKALWAPLKDPDWLRAVRDIVGETFEEDWIVDRKLSDRMVGAF
ncbi:kinase-like protein [Trametes cingulata]|nr:kinase-like protein [Trametes cingulata]